MALSAPVRGLRTLLHRSWAPTESHVRQYADAQAVRIVGPDAVRSFLDSTLHVPRGQVAAQVAARNRKDPFEAIAASPRPAQKDMVRRLDQAERSQEGVDPRDIAQFRGRLSSRYAEELIHGRI